MTSLLLDGPYKTHIGTHWHIDMALVEKLTTQRFYAQSINPNPSPNPRA